MIRNPQEIWSDCLSIIKDNVKASCYSTWFEPIKPLQIKDDALTIQVPSQFFVEYLEEQYIDLLKKTLRKVIGENARLNYYVVMSEAPQQGKVLSVKYPANDQPRLNNRPMPAALGRDVHSIKNPFIIPGIQKLQIDPQLKKDNTFDNFIEGECNRLARAAGYAVAQKPGGTAYNPLLIYGDSGLGKTHLAQAIGIEVKNKYPEKVVLYVNASHFVTQYSEAAKNNTRNDFMHFYQMIDVLILDDIHELSGKQGTQEVFFHIFNHLHQTGKQLILTSDKSPIEIKGIEERLLSRLKWGLTTDLQIPDVQTRLAILKSKACKDGIEMPEDVLRCIAENICTNVRELEGALISLLAQSTLNRKAITIDLAMDMINKIVRQKKQEITIDYIQKVVCDYFNMPADSLQSKTRKREVVQARQIAMFFCKTLTKSSLATIGANIGNKDHATVLHACKTVHDLIDTNKQFKGDIEAIEKRLKK